jgi:hypothetical protein
MPHPPRRPNQTEGIYQEEDYAEDYKRSFEQHFAGGVVHLGSPIFNEETKLTIALAGWQRSNLVPAQLVITVPACGRRCRQANQPCLLDLGGGQRPWAKAKKGPSLPFIRVLLRQGAPA